MIQEISAIVAVVIFAILAIFIIVTLFAMRRTLLGIDRMTDEITQRLDRFDSTLQTISNLGEISQAETDKLKMAYLVQQNAQATPKYSSSNDIAEWLIASLKLGSKLFQRR